MNIQDYLNPKSITFWCGVVFILKGIAWQAFGVDLPIPDEVIIGGVAVGLRKAIAQLVTANNGKGGEVTCAKCGGSV